MSSVPAPIVRHFRRFDPTSSTVIHCFANGACMGDFMPNGSIMFIDTSMRPNIGDLAAIAVPRRDGGGAMFYVKQLEQVDGRLWGLSEDAPMPIAKGMNVIGTLVASMTSLRPAPAPVGSRDPDTYAALLRHAAPMLARAARRGFDRKAPVK